MQESSYKRCKDCGTFRWTSGRFLRDNGYGCPTCGSPFMRLYIGHPPLTKLPHAIRQYILDMKEENPGERWRFWHTLTAAAIMVKSFLTPDTAIPKDVLHAE